MYRNFNVFALTVHKSTFGVKVLKKKLRPVFKEVIQLNTNAATRQKKKDAKSLCGQNASRNPRKLQIAKEMYRPLRIVVIALQVEA